MPPSAQVTVAQARRLGTARLGGDGAGLEADLLLARCLGWPRARLYARGEEAVPGPVMACYEALLRQRLEGRPVAHLLGRREFWSLELECTPEALVPRPETEHLVEAALSRIPADARWNVADLGTGTGAVALAIGSERPACLVLATDLSSQALALAARNVARLAAGNVVLARGDWAAPLVSAAFQVVVANPPYVAETDPHLARRELQFEPRGALVAGPDGLTAVRRLLVDAGRALAPGGWLLLEHGHDQGPAVRALLSGAGYGAVETLPDLAGHQRVSGGMRL